jgi:hypothetical protein
MQKTLPFTLEDLKNAPVHLLRDGRWGNACVSVAEVAGSRWTIKDFSSRPWIVRNTFARFILGREAAAIRDLKGLDGVPQQAFFLSPCILAIEYIPGRVLARVPDEEVSVKYLEESEKLIASLHQRNRVHLDTRGTSNWIMTPEGKPALIDFQASFSTAHLPASIRSFMEDMDRGGVLKKWNKYHPNEMGEERYAEFLRINELRKLWVLRGYFGVKKKHAKHGKPIDN